VAGKVLRIFVASPGDVSEERNYVHEIAASVNRSLSKLGYDTRIVVSGWETDIQPGLHPRGIQAKIDEELIKNIDAMVAVFWKRFGNPVEDAGSPTEHEINLALKMWKASSRPQLWLFFRNSPIQPKTSAETKQYLQIQRFKEKFQKANLGRTRSIAALETSLDAFIL
jgi:hypothetical protein